MADGTLSPVASAVLPPHAAAWDGARGDHHPQRRRSRQRPGQRLLEAVVPGREPDQVEVVFEYAEGQFLGVSIRDRASGAELVYLNTDDLREREAAPGLLLERQG
jgi:hypothetical protein